MIIAQISDSHITDGAGGDRHTDHAVHLQRAVAHLLQLPAPPDVVLVTGDCVNNGRRSEYTSFQELIRPLTMPVYIVPGNHDDRPTMLQHFGVQGSQPLDGFIQYVIDSWPVRLIGLDTHVPQRSEGQLCSERLAWLDARLKEAPTRPTIIFMHHPPFRTGLTVLDAIGLVDADAFGAIITRHPQVVRIVAGHVHSTMLQYFHGTLAMTCPSTAHAMLPDFHQPERLAVTMEPPACLLHVWSDNTGLVTHTSLIGDHGPVIEIHDGTQWRS